MEKKKNNSRKKKIATKKNPTPKNKEKDFELGSDNIFADLGFARPEDELAKAELALQIYHIIKQKKLTQVQAAALLGIDQAKVSALMTGKLSGFSIERLFRFLNDLGQDIVIKVSKSRTRKKGSTKVGTPKQIQPTNSGSTRSDSPTYGLYAKKR
jgi:predicted XRE-type DNA-binding protein